MKKEDKSPRGYRSTIDRAYNTNFEAVSVGHRLRLVREFLGERRHKKMTQAEFASPAKGAQSNWSYYENGKIMLPIEVAWAICNHMPYHRPTRADLYWLYGGDTDNLSEDFKGWLHSSS